MDINGNIPSFSGNGENTFLKLSDIFDLYTEYIPVKQLSEIFMHSSKLKTHLTKILNMDVQLRNINSSTLCIKKDVFRLTQYNVLLKKTFVDDKELLYLISELEYYNILRRGKERCEYWINTLKEVYKDVEIKIVPDIQEFLFKSNFILPEIASFEEETEFIKSFVTNVKFQKENTPKYRIKNPIENLLS